MYILTHSRSCSCMCIQHTSAEAILEACQMKHAMCFPCDQNLKTPLLTISKLQYKENHENTQGCKNGRSFSLSDRERGHMHAPHELWDRIITGSDLLTLSRSWVRLQPLAPPTLECLMSQELLPHHATQRSTIHNTVVFCIGWIWAHKKISS